MQNIYLIRDGISSEGGVTGRLIFADSVLYTLEPSRTDPIHVGHPAIPAGRYKVGTSMSTRFKRMLPILFDVPGRTGIRFHSGDSVLDTEGCILLFQKYWPIGRGTSRKSENQFVEWLSKCAINKEDVWLRVIDA